MSNWHDRHRTSADHEHERDLRKHDLRPGDKGYTPHRFDVPIRTAMEVVAEVKRMTDYVAAAALIEQYASEKRSQEMLDAVAAGARP